MRCGVVEEFSAVVRAAKRRSFDETLAETRRPTTSISHRVGDQHLKAGAKKDRTPWGGRTTNST
jgi:hypothetical protein